MKMFLKIDNGIVEDVFKTFGCGAAIATSSMATELIKGKTIEEALQPTNKAVMNALTDFRPQKYTALFWRNKHKAAIADYYIRQGIDPTPFVGELKTHDHDVAEGCSIEKHKTSVLWAEVSYFCN